MGVSYPNRFIRNLMNQLSVDDWTYEWSPKWANGKRYDIYFKLNNQEYIIEMNGSQHYFDSQWDLAQNVQQNDINKEKLALEHNIPIIWVDCRSSRLEYIKKNILNSKLNDIFELSDIDWMDCERKSISILMKEVCKYYNENPTSYEEIGKLFHISSATVGRYIRHGAEIGICNYSKEEHRQISAKVGKQKLYKAIQVYDLNGDLAYEFDSITNTIKIMNQLYPNKNIREDGIRDVLKNKISHHHGFIFKYANEENEQTVQDNLEKINHWINWHQVAAYNENGQLIGTYPSLEECARDLNTRYPNHNFKASAIGAVCDGKQSTHRNFIFKTVEDNAIKQTIVPIKSQRQTYVFEVWDNNIKINTYKQIKEAVNELSQLYPDKNITYNSLIKYIKRHKINNSLEYKGLQLIFL